MIARPYNTSTTIRHLLHMSIIIGIILFFQSILLTLGFYEQDKWLTYLNAYDQLNVNYSSELKIDCNKPLVQSEFVTEQSNILNSGKGIEVCNLKMFDRKYNYISTSFIIEMFFKFGFFFDLYVNILLNLILHCLLFLTFIKILRL